MVPSPDRRGWGAPGEVGLSIVNRPDGVRFAINAAIADLVATLLDLTELAGYDLIPGQCWGFARRKVAGTNVWSTHAWGLAVDLNAPSNWRGGRGDIPDHVVDMWENNGFAWGGMWLHTDPMHFEFMGTPADARAITARLREFLTPTPAQPAPTTEENDMRMLIDTRDQTVWLFGCGNAKSLGGAPEQYRRLLAMGIPVTEDDGLLVDFLRH